MSVVEVIEAACRATPNPEWIGKVMVAYFGDSDEAADLAVNLDEGQSVIYNMLDHAERERDIRRMRERDRKRAYRSGKGKAK